MNILLTEDDPATSTILKRMLLDENLNVSSVCTGEEAVDLARHFYFDMIILDLGLPDMHGNEVLTQLRQSKINTPVLILSGSDDLDSKVESFKKGADDYVTKPCKFSELLARIHAVVRRSKGLSQSAICIGDISLHLGSKTVEVKGKDIALTRREYQVLEFLSLRAARAVSRDAIMSYLYSDLAAGYPNDKIVDAFIYNIRKKISTAAAGKCHIKSIRGVGFMVDTPANCEEDAKEERRGLRDNTHFPAKAGRALKECSQ